MGCSLKSEKELKKEGRGGMDMKVIKKADVVLVSGSTMVLSTLPQPRSALVKLVWLKVGV